MRKYKMKRTAAICVIALSMVFAGVQMWKEYGPDAAAAATEAGMETQMVTVETQAGRKIEVELEIAATPVDIEIGLMHRKSMPENHGMLFLLGKPAKEAGFWMKNTLIPLDIIFVDAEGRIARIHARTQPMNLSSYSSDAPVVAAIELNGGMAEKWGIAVGDRVHHEYFRQ